MDLVLIIELLEFSNKLIQEKGNLENEAYNEALI